MSYYGWITDHNPPRKVVPSLQLIEAIKEEYGSLSKEAMLETIEDELLYQLPFGNEGDWKKSLEIEKAEINGVMDDSGTVHYF